MPPDIVNAIAPLVAMLMTGTFGLIGFRLWLAHRPPRGQGKLGAEQLERLTEVMEDIRQQLDVMRDENLELHERMDFAERLLAQRDRPDAQLEKPHQTPV
jgi:hypothetical protein